jgi:hypothetical protein
MIDIKFGALFPWQFRFLALLFIFVGFVLIQNHVLISLSLITAAAFIITAYEGTEINMNNNTFRGYTAFFFFKTGKFENYTKAESLFITKSIQSEQIYTAHTTHSSTFKDVVYHAYLKRVHGEPIHLLSSKNREKLIKKLAPLSEGLNMEIIAVA